MLTILAIAASATLAIYWEKRSPAIWHYILKPLTTLGIILVVLSHAETFNNLYLQLILLGLIFCLAGDIFLMLPKDRFLPGLVSFLMGQILYASAFIRSASDFSLLIGLPILIYGIWMFYLLQPHLGQMKIAVLVYMVFILIMVWSALNLWWDIGELFAVYAAVGAVLFVISDSVLAWNRFVSSHPLYRPLILGSYFIAQFLIASSVIQ
ncbi:MAG: lysoplasmalogenase [Lentisphaeria bacterium]|nr:lysoplasmalogenase [Candidatus Neomarinimicrobiota bacterium]MCF7841668.1 lysoplasmalogenase [Lentisphaeria bacterium]